MSILFVGGEPGDFAASSTATGYSTVTAYRRTAYSRCSLDTSTSSYYYDTPALATEHWTTFRYYFGTTAGTTANFWTLRYGSADLVHIKIVSLGSSSTYGIYTVNSGTETLRATSTDSLASSTMYKLDIHVNYSASGEITLYANGNSLVSYTGDIPTLCGSPTIDSLINRFRSAVSSGYTGISEVVIMTTDTRNISGVITKYPTGAGAYTSGFGSATYTTVADYSLDSVYATSTVAGETITYSTQATTITSSPSIMAVVERMNVYASTVSPMSIIPNIYTNSSLVSGSTVSPSTQSTIIIDQTWTSNPITGSAWTTSEISSLQLGATSAT